VLRGTAITTVRSNGRAICVVSLPNSAGGVRQVPVLDAGVNARLLALAARAGNDLVLAPNREFAERNIVNRIGEDMRRRGYPGLQPAALRNRWILDLAERIPAALLLQLADVLDVRVLSDQRGQLPHYKVRHTITLLQEGPR
jgi:DNA-binding PucR family transcriptional regulator